MADESLPPDASDEILENNLRSEQARKAREIAERKVGL